MLKNIWNKIKVLSGDDEEDALDTLNAGKSLPYPNWTELVNLFSLG